MGTRYHKLRNDALSKLLGAKPASVIQIASITNVSNERYLLAVAVEDNCGHGDAVLQSLFRPNVTLPQLQTVDR